MSSIGPYTVVAKLGEGATSAVFRVVGPHGQPLALKLLHREGLTPEQVSRFARERQLQQALGADAGFLPVLDSGTATQGPFLVLPLCEGGSLRERLRHGPLPVAWVLDVVGRLAESLARAHAQGVVHRDLKPENLLFAQEDALQVADLGLAKRFDEVDQDVLSQTGTMRGTVDYMPPEQMEDAKRAGPTADVYAWGVIAYECLTGQPPFRGATPFEVIALVEQGRAQPLRKLRPEVGAPLAELIHRCLARDPDRRPADGAALRDALAEALAGGHRRPRRAGAVAFAVLALGALGAGLLLGVGLNRGAAPSGQEAPTRDAPEELTWAWSPSGGLPALGAAPPVCLALDPAGEALAIGWSDGRVALYDADSGAPQRSLRRRRRVDALCFGPAGAALYVASAAGGLEREPLADGGTVTLVATAASELRRSADGALLFASGDSGVTLVDARRGTKLGLHRVGAPGRDRLVVLDDGLLVLGADVRRGTLEAAASTPGAVRFDAVAVDGQVRGPGVALGGRLVLCTGGGQLVQTGLPDPQAPAPLVLEPVAVDRAVVCLAVDRVRGRVFAGDREGGVTCLEADAEGRLVPTWRRALHGGPVQALAVHPGGDLVSAGAEGRVLRSGPGGEPRWASGPVSIDDARCGAAGSLFLRRGRVVWLVDGAARLLDGPARPGGRLLLDEARGRAYRVGETVEGWDLAHGERLGEQPAPLVGAQATAATLREGAVWVAWATRDAAGVYAYDGGLSGPAELVAEGRARALCAGGAPGWLALDGQLQPAASGPSPRWLGLVEASGGALLGWAGRGLARLRGPQGERAPGAVWQLEGRLPERLALSPDGTRLAVLGDGVLEVRTLEPDGLPLVASAPLPLETGVLDLRFVREDLVRVATDAGALIDLRPGADAAPAVAGFTLNRRLELPEPAPTAGLLAVDPSGTWLATHPERGEGPLQVHRAVDGQAVATLTHSLGTVHALAFAPDGGSLWVGGQGGAQQLALAPGPPLRDLRDATVKELHPLPAGTLLRGDDWTAWHPTAGEPSTLPGACAQALVRADGRGAWLVGQGFRELPFPAAPGRGRRDRTLTPPLLLTPDGARIAFVREGELQVRDLAPEGATRSVGALPSGVGVVQELAWGGASGQRVFLRDEDELFAFELEGPRREARAALVGGKSVTTRALPGGGLVISSAAGGLQRFGDALDQVPLPGLAAPGPKVGLAIFSRDPARAVRQTDEGLQLWAPFEAARLLAGPPRQFYAASLARSGRWLAVLDAGGVRAWDLDTEQEVLTWAPPAGDAVVLMDVCFRGEDTLLVTGHQGDDQRPDPRTVVVGAPLDESGIDAVVYTVTLGSAAAAERQVVRGTGHALAVGGVELGGWVLATTSGGVQRYDPATGDVVTLRAGRLSGAALGPDLRVMLARPHQVQPRVDQTLTIGPSPCTGVDLREGDLLPDAVFTTWFQRRGSFVDGLAASADRRWLALYAGPHVDLYFDGEWQQSLELADACRAASFSNVGSCLTTLDARGGVRRYTR